MMFFSSAARQLRCLSAVKPVGDVLPEVHHSLRYRGAARQLRCLSAVKHPPTAHLTGKMHGPANRGTSVLRRMRLAAGLGVGASILCGDCHRAEWFSAWPWNAGRGWAVRFWLGSGWEWGQS